MAFEGFGVSLGFFAKARGELMRYLKEIFGGCKLTIRYDLWSKDLPGHRRKGMCIASKVH